MKLVSLFPRIGFAPKLTITRLTATCKDRQRRCKENDTGRNFSICCQNQYFLFLPYYFLLHGEEACVAVFTKLFRIQVLTTDLAASSRYSEEIEKERQSRICMSFPTQNFPALRLFWKIVVETAGSTCSFRTQVYYGEIDSSQQKQIGTYQIKQARPDFPLNLNFSISQSLFLFSPKQKSQNSAKPQQCFAC